MSMEFALTKRKSLVVREYVQYTRMVTHEKSTKIDNFSEPKSETNPHYLILIKKLLTVGGFWLLSFCSFVG